MDARRPSRLPPSRRALFHPSSSSTTASTSTTSTTAASSRPRGFPSNASKQSSLHLPHSDSQASLHASSPTDELVERDSSGNYKIMGPTTGMKMGVGGPRDGGAAGSSGGIGEGMDMLGSSEGVGFGDEEQEQENQMIGLWGKANGRWDQAAILEEIQAALQSSLERKVRSLENDRWMFEGEKGGGRGR